jgi:RHS repeat-associated protein
VVGSATTIFLYDNARIVEERDGSDSVQATYTYGYYIDEVLTKDAGSDRYFYHQNTLWSVHALTDAAGAVVERYTYDAYGTITVLDPAFLPLSSAPLGYFTFMGREFDAETGLYHYRARTYGPGLGRFYSRDPMGYVDGMNLYEYVKGRVVNHVDPSGLTGFWCCTQMIRNWGKLGLQMRYYEIENLLEASGIEDGGDTDGVDSCFDVNSKVLEYYENRGLPWCWGCKLIRRVVLAGYPWLGQWVVRDHYAVICESKNQNGYAYDRILFDYWGDRPPGEDPSVWFEIHYPYDDPDSQDGVYGLVATKK